MARVFGAATFKTVENRLKRRGFLEWEASLTKQSTPEKPQIVSLAWHPEGKKWFVFQFTQGDRELEIILETVHRTSAKRTYDERSYRC